MSPSKPDNPLEEAAESPSAARPNRLKKVLMLSAAGFLLIGSLTGILVLFFPRFVPEFLSFRGLSDSGQVRMKIGKEEKTPVKKRTAGHIHIMDPLIVNLADVDQSRYLKVRINLESNKKEPDEEYSQRLPQLRDIILSILSNKNSPELLDSGGKAKLKDEIIRNVNPVLSSFKIQEIYFTEFVIQ